MAERIARLGLMHYKDADGRIRDAWAGETIQVHPDFVDLFDELNVLPGGEPKTAKPEPKATKAEEPVEDKPKPRRGRPRKADSEE